MILLTALAGMAADPDIVAHWTAFDDNRLCTIVRAFPTDGAVLSIMPWPIGQRTEITVTSDGRGPDVARGNGRLVSDAGGRAEGRRNASALTLSARHFGRGTLTIGRAAPVVGGVASGIDPAATADEIDLRVTSIDLPVALPALTEGAALAIDSEVVDTPPLTLTATAEAMATLRSCRAAQLKGWGMDPDEEARITTPVAPDTGAVTGWFSSGSYPKNALKRGEEGIAIIRWTIGTDGRTSDCAAVQSSGSAALDAGSCAVILAHRYRSPARDAAGRPMISHGLRRVAWRLPQD